jgi:ATP-dependent RNA helicase DHX8/PRP22
MEEDSDEDLIQLEYLALVNKIANELLNHVGLDDKVLAEFVIHQHCSSKDLDSFVNTMLEMNSFESSFLINLDRLIVKLLPIKIKLKLQKKNKRRQKKDKQEINKQTNTKFPGLAIQDDPKRISKMMEDDINKQNNTIFKRPSSPDVPKSEPLNGRDHSNNRNRSRSPDRRSRSPSRRRRDSPQSGNRRSRSPSGKRGRDRSPSRRNSNSTDTPLKRVKLDPAPILHKVYSGSVAGVKDFGAFVSLHGIEKRSDGLVHISNLSASRMRVGHPSEIVEIGKKVWVKIISLEGGRIGLSLKDVDQETGILCFN